MQAEVVNQKMGKENGGRRSLRKKTARIIARWTLLLIVLISLAGQMASTYSLLRMRDDESLHMAEYAFSLMDREYIEKLYAETKQMMDHLPQEAREDQYSDAFISLSRPLADDKFMEQRDILVKCRENTELRNLALIYTDPVENTLVFVVDGDELGWAYLPGQHMGTNVPEIEQVSRSDWRMRITYAKDYGWIATDYIPLFSSAGDQMGYIMVDMDVNEVLASIIRVFLLLVPLSVLIVLWMTWTGARFLEKGVISHVEALSASARDYIAGDKVAQIDDGRSYFKDLNIRTEDEFQDLWESIVEMESDVKESMRRLKEVTAEQERMEAELSIAARIQYDILPHTFPAFPERKEFDLYASMTPAREVGGDFYDYFLIDDDHLALVIADVSGKGISAALFMANAKAMLKNQTLESGEDVAAICRKVNDRLYAQNDAMMFVTVYLAVLTISSGEVVYVNAGHEYPAIRSNGQDFIAYKDVHGLALSIMGGMKYKSGTYKLEPGDTVFLYTDGVTEANAGDRVLFGTDRLLDVLNKNPDDSPQGLTESVLAAVKEFTGDKPQFDDTTMLALRYFGPGENHQGRT